jgi:hypothetical protein
MTKKKGSELHEIHAWYEEAASYPGIRIESVTPLDSIESTLYCRAIFINIPLIA